MLQKLKVDFISGSTLYYYYTKTLRVIHDTAKIKKKNWFISKFHMESMKEAEVLRFRPICRLCFLNDWVEILKNIYPTEKIKHLESVLLPGSPNEKHCVKENQMNEDLVQPGHSSPSDL